MGKMPMLQGTIREVAGTEVLPHNLTRLRKKLCAPTQNTLRLYAKWSTKISEGAGKKQG